jgi:hypothetical protein
MTSFDILNNENNNIFITINIDKFDNLNYYDIHELYNKYIITDIYYIIFNDDKQIYTNLFHDYNNNKLITLNNLRIQFMNYEKEEIYRYSKDFEYDRVTELLKDKKLIGNKLMNDKLFMLFAIQKCGWMYYFASDNLKNNIEFILFASRLNGSILKLVSDNFKDEININLSTIMK